MQFEAFLFDLNGTMINDMHYHINAWYTIFKNLGSNLSYEEMKEQCYGKNEELIERIFPNKYTKAEKEQMSLEKELDYQTNYAPELCLIDGLHKFLNQAFEDNIKMAIGSAAIQLNVDFVLNGLQISNYFSAVVSANNVIKSKPSAETFLKCADALQVKPKNCLVFEDAPKGVAAAYNANMPCVVITSTHKKEEFSECPNIIMFINDYNNLYEKLN
jgi:HAD superfamily hydrolase (TIGR01509 family)